MWTYTLDLIFLTLQVRRSWRPELRVEEDDESNFGAV